MNHNRWSKRVAERLEKMTKMNDPWAFAWQEWVFYWGETVTDTWKFILFCFCFSMTTMPTRWMQQRKCFGLIGIFLPSIGAREERERNSLKESPFFPRNSEALQTCKDSVLLNMYAFILHSGIYTPVTNSYPFFLSLPSYLGNVGSSLGRILMLTSDFKFHEWLPSQIYS